MRNQINRQKNIEHILSSFKPNESVSLSSHEKSHILKSVFERAEKRVLHYKAVKSPIQSYKTYFVQYLRYSIPVLLVAFIGTQAAGIFHNRSKIALNDIQEVRTSIDEIKRDNSIKSNLYKNKQDIQEIKLSLASANPSSPKTEMLAAQLSSRSKEIRNQVASLVSENKLTEAKKVALDLESALKADELYKVATSVKDEVFEAIDLRVDIENKESLNISSTTKADVQTRIDQAKKDILTFEANASTTDMIASAQTSIDTSEKHLIGDDLANAIISLQLYDRIVAELESILLP